MAEEFGAQGLSGLEAKKDLIAQFEKRLNGDCNFRSNDSYSRGYSAEIIYKVKLYGLDTVSADGEFEVGTAQNDPDADVVEGKVEIPQEENLAVVRDRIAGDDAPGPDEDETPEPISEAGVRAKRKYTRKVQLASPGVIGGAEDFKE